MLAQQKAVQSNFYYIDFVIKLKVAKNCFSKTNLSSWSQNHWRGTLLQMLTRCGESTFTKLNQKLSTDMKKWLSSFSRYFDSHQMGRAYMVSKFGSVNNLHKPWGLVYIYSTNYSKSLLPLPHLQGYSICASIISSVIWKNNLI